MLDYDIQDGLTKISLKWRDLSVYIYTYICKNTTRNLDREIKLRNISPDKPITLIPKTLIKTPLQFIQGSIHYALMSSKITRIRNQGLLLAIFTTGIDQLSELINTLSSEIEKGIDYYLLGVDTQPVNLDDCYPYTIRELGDGVNDVIVKNINQLLSMI